MENEYDEYVYFKDHTLYHEIEILKKDIDFLKRRINLLDGSIEGIDLSRRVAYMEDSQNKLEILVVRLKDQISSMDDDLNELRTKICINATKIILNSDLAKNIKNNYNDLYYLGSKWIDRFRNKL
jgi:chromosome segregation ATPase